MAARKALVKTPDAQVEQARTSFMTAVANTITDALPTPGGDSGTWGPKLNTFLTDLGALVFSKISSVNGRTPDGNGDLDLDSVYATTAQLGTIASSVTTEQDARQVADALLAPLANPALTGAPTAPTPSVLDNSTKVATTAYADSAVGVESGRAQSAESGMLLTSGGNMSGPLDLGYHKITGVANGSAPTDVATVGQIPGGVVTATTDPLVTSDSAHGYSVGAGWINTSTSALFTCLNATAGAAVWQRQTANVQVFTSSGTWTKPAWAQTVTATCIASGAGGGAGAQQVSGIACSGGAGGGGGGVSTRTLPASACGATESVSVFAGGAGGAGQSATSTAGATGSSGSSSLFGSHVRAAGATGGTGGALNAVSASSAGGAGLATGGTGASGANGGVGANAASGPTSGGGAGGGISAAVAAFAGGAGQQSSASNFTGGTAGTTAGGAGGAGTPAVTGEPASGGSGGGGGSSVTGVGGGGGAGGVYGAGGGGGGASLNGFTSGAGGAGAGGIVVVVTT